MIFSGMTSSNTAEYKFYLKSGVFKFQFIIIIISSDVPFINCKFSGKKVVKFGISADIPIS